MFLAFLALAENPLEHIVRHPMKQMSANLGWLSQGGKITLLDSHIVMMMLAALLLLLLVPVSVRKRRGTGEVDALVPTGAGNVVEAICEYLRKDVVQPTLGPYTDRFVKFIWTIFFFVLTVNLLGILPLGWTKPLFGVALGGAATANLWITATLALITLGMILVNGLRLGGMQFITHSPAPCGWPPCWCRSRSSASSPASSPSPSGCSPTWWRGTFCSRCS
jgi:F0F1-type ATP synthase membrane subunit a